MAYKIGDRMHTTFLPPAINDYIGDKDPVRVYDSFVEALDFNELGISLTDYQAGADEYYPKAMLKVILYGYSYGIRSFRKLERACHHNLSFIWLNQADGAKCRACIHFGDPAAGKCTKSEDGRRIIRLVHEEFKEQTEANYKRPENQEIYKLRKEKAEHPFGHMKRNLGAGQFMLRGLPKVNAEVSLLAACFNIARMMTIVGIPQLLVKLAGS